MCKECDSIRKTIMFYSASPSPDVQGVIFQTVYLLSSVFAVKPNSLHHFIFQKCLSAVLKIKYV